MEPDYKCEKKLFYIWKYHRCRNRARFNVIAKSPRTEQEEEHLLCGIHKNQLLRSYDPDATVKELDQ